MAPVAVLVGGLFIAAGAQAKNNGDNSQAAVSADAIGKHTIPYAGSDGDYLKFLDPSAPNRNHGGSPTAPKTSATQQVPSIVDNSGRHAKGYTVDGDTLRARNSMSLKPVKQLDARTSSAWVEDPSKAIEKRAVHKLRKASRSTPIELSAIFTSLLALGTFLGVRMRRMWSQPPVHFTTRDITTEMQTGVQGAALPDSAAMKAQQVSRGGGWCLPPSQSSRPLTVLYAAPSGSTAEGALICSTAALYSTPSQQQHPRHRSEHDEKAKLLSPKFRDQHDEKAKLLSLNDAMTQTIPIPNGRAATGDEVDSVEDALRTVADAQWAPVIQEIASKAGGPGAVAALRRAVEKLGDESAPDAAYASCFPFDLDEYQLDALRHLRNDSNVIVSAPTGSGKTVAGELAIAYALARGERVFYTTPLKALSNQKFEDFCKFFGSENVGLSTGDSGVRRDAPVVVMTTEIYRNMLYEDAPAPFAVVFDEFHYMNDPSRGTVWEESVISSSDQTKIVALSATVSNDEQVRGWIRKVHGPTEVVSSSFRPVPLKYEFACGALRDVVPLFRAVDVGPGSPREAEELKNGGARQRAKKRLRLNPLLENVVERRDEAVRRTRSRGRDRDDIDRRDRSRSRGRDRDRAPSAMHCSAVARNLQRRDLLPAIFFVFSRRGCEEEAMRVGSLLQLLSIEEETEARSIVRAWALDNEDIATLDSEGPRIQLLTRGVAAHHAGLLPQYKTLVEDLFKRGLVKACFATETLAAGVNLPARTTIITALRKRGDDGIEPLTTAGLLQMAGRAGRRGKDDAGTVLVMRGHRNGAGDADLARRILLSKVAPIGSHFAPSYGMACSLLRRHAGSLERCKMLVERSFGSYLARKGSSNSDVDAFAKLVNAAKERADMYEKLFDDPATPVDVLAKEKALLRKAQKELLASPIAQLTPDAQRQVLETRRERKESRESPDWRSFVAITGVLREFKALDDNHEVTQLGALVAALKGDNELLLALSLLDEATLEVATEGSPDEFAALCSAFVSEVGSRPGAFVDYGPTPRVRNAVDELWRTVLQPLSIAQYDAGLGPDDGLHLRLDDSAAGLVEAWASGGVSWEQISESTSLDHGDLIRLFRRTLDVLRTTASLDAAILPDEFAPVREAARLAVQAIDRPPVHDTTYDAVFVPNDEEEQEGEEEEEKDGVEEESEEQEGE